MMDGALVVSLTTRAITDCNHRKQFAFGSERLQIGTIDGFCDVVGGCGLFGCLAFLVVVCPSLAVIKSVTAVLLFFLSFFLSQCVCLCMCACLPACLSVCLKVFEFSLSLSPLSLSPSLPPCLIKLTVAWYLTAAQRHKFQF